MEEKMAFPNWRMEKHENETIAQGKRIDCLSRQINQGISF